MNKKRTFVYRCGINQQVKWHTEKELSDEEMIQEAKKRLPKIQIKYNLNRGIYRRKLYELTKYDKKFLSNYKASKSGIFAKDIYSRYKMKVSYFSEVIAGYNQFTTELDKMFKYENRSTRQDNGVLTRRKFYYCKLK